MKSNFSLMTLMILFKHIFFITANNYWRHSGASFSNVSVKARGIIFNLGLSKINNNEDSEETGTIKNKYFSIKTGYLFESKK